jgi:hypothetical protein
MLNSRLAPGDLTRACRLDRESRVLIETAIARLGMSARLPSSTQARAHLR